MSGREQVYNLKVDYRAVIAWERIMREIEEAEPSTVRRRLAALSSLFKHLKRHHHIQNNPVADVERPAINRREGSTLAFAEADAAKLPNTPAEDTIEGLRDRVILSVGLQVGLRRAEIAALSGEDLHQNRGFDSLRIVRKGGRRDALAIHPNVAQRIRAYLDAAGHADDLDGPVFRPLSHNRKSQEGRRYMDPDAIDRVLRKHAKTIGWTRGYSAPSMRATFITTVLENGATLDDVQRAAGRSEPGTTKLYDRRGYNPEKSASFFATYWTTACRCPPGPREYNGGSDERLSAWLVTDQPKDLELRRVVRGRVDHGFGFVSDHFSPVARCSLRW
jgi:site-specific recombinase XerD